MKPQSTPSSEFVIGRLSVSRQGSGFVSRDDGGDDILIQPTRIGDALHRDLVQVEITASRSNKSGSQGRVEGVVVEILERSQRTFVALLRTEMGGGNWDPVLIPQDDRLPPEITAHEVGDARDGDLVACEWVDYPSADQPASARVLRVLGGSNDAVRETDAIVYRLGLPVEFPADVEAEAAARPDVIDDAELRRRHDLRGRPLFTVDPESARDFDDAVSAERTAEGGWVMTVAIADVCHQVPAGSRLDTEARERSTSIYLPDRVIPMLPERLSGDLCSLRPGVARLAMVVEFGVSSEGELGRYELYEAVVCSRARITYDRAARMLGLMPGSGGLGSLTPAVPDHDDAVEELRPVAEALLACTRALRARRRRRGYLELDLSEPRIFLDTDGEIDDIRPAERHEAHQMIEEAMIAANEVVARHFTARQRPALFRLHDPPKPDALLAYNRQTVGLAPPFRPKDPITPAQVGGYLRAHVDHPQARLLHGLMLRSMTRAYYHASAGLHFGLGTRHYLHFTSPIRRFPDLIVHRLLKAELHQGEVPPGVDGALNEAALCRLAGQCSRREQNALDAERSVADLYKALYLSRHVGEEFDSTVIGVTSIGLFVQLNGHFVEGLIRLDALWDDYYDVDLDAGELVGRDTGQTYRLGQAVRIRVASVDVIRRHVNFELAGQAKKRPSRSGRRRGRG